jgi:hypothetical protein
MKNLFLLLSIALLFSCKKEDEYISFAVTINNYSFGEDHLVIEYSIIAPGRVTIDDHGVEYKELMDVSHSEISFGPLKTPGQLSNMVKNLVPGKNYEFAFYAISGGVKRRITKLHTGSTSPPK